MIINVQNIWYLLYSFFLFLGEEYTDLFKLIRKNWREVSSFGTIAQLGNVIYTLSYRGYIGFLMNPWSLLLALIFRFYIKQEELASKAAKPVDVKSLPPFLRDKLKKAEKDSKTSAIRAEGISVADMMRRRRLAKMSDEKKAILRVRALIPFMYIWYYTICAIRNIMGL